MAEWPLGIPCGGQLLTVLTGRWWLGLMVVYMGGEARKVFLGKDECGDQKECF